MEQRAEKPEFLTEQLITYIGNKRALLDFIGDAVERVRQRLAKKKLVIGDLFSGSGIVTRFLKRFAGRLVANDLENYCEVINKCYLSNEAELDLGKLRSLHRELSSRLDKGPLEPGFITELYAPKNDEAIDSAERVFYTNRNARYLDTARRLIETIPPDLQHFFLAPLLSQASIHANTAGVFKGFYKNSLTNTGQFGGNNQDSLSRILKNITLPFPLFSHFSCETSIYRTDANSLAGELDEMDLVYLDPPYNQHPYGSNYFMLNLLTAYQKPDTISSVSGIPVDWKRSAYNKPKPALQAFFDLIETLRSKFILISFNSEGFIEQQVMKDFLEKIGSYEIMEVKYNTFRGSRNLTQRSIHVKEFFYLVEKA